MSLQSKNFAGYTLTTLGLGCARMGSFTGMTAREAETLILRARDSGITFFDTASSYGQGDSERILGRLVGGDDKVCLATKVGKTVPTKARMLRPFKGIVRRLTHSSFKINSTVRKSRGVELPVNFDTDFLNGELIKCYRRTGLSTLPMVMLHSVDAMNIKRGEAMDVLERAQIMGNIRIIGASVDDLEAAEACLDDSRIQAVQIPYTPHDSAMAEWTIRANKMGKLVVARKVLDGVLALPKGDRAAQVKKNLLRSVSDPAVGVTLVGTSKIAHFEEIIAMTSGLAP